MAGEAERRRDRVTRVLVECQTVRERAARLALLRARTAQEASQARSREAGEAAARAVREKSEGMRTRYAALLGASTGETGLRAVRDASSRMVAECERAASAQRAAAAEDGAASAAVQEASRLLGAEVQRGRKRGRMAESARERLGAVLAGLEDEAMEDETGDRMAARPAAAC